MPPFRKRLRRYEIYNGPRFVTFSCHNRLRLLGTPALRDAFAAQLEDVHRRGAFRLIAWVLMPEHVHLLLIPSLPEWPLSRSLQAVKQPFASRVLRRWRAMNAPILKRLCGPAGHYRVWLRGGGYDLNIETPAAALAKAEYMHANPGRRGLVTSPEAWRWSSARWYAGHRSGPVTIDPLDFW